MPMNVLVGLTDRPFACLLFFAIWPEISIRIPCPKPRAYDRTRYTALSTSTRAAVMVTESPVLY